MHTQYNIPFIMSSFDQKSTSTYVLWSHADNTCWCLHNLLSCCLTSGRQHKHKNSQILVVCFQYILTSLHFFSRAFKKGVLGQLKKLLVLAQLRHNFWKEDPFSQLWITCAIHLNRSMPSTSLLKLKKITCNRKASVYFLRP